MTFPFNQDGGRAPRPGFGSGGGSLPNTLSLFDQVRLERQAATFQRVGCVGGCPMGTVVNYVVPMRAQPGEEPNVKVRCSICLTYYEIDQQGKVINVRRVVEELSEAKRR